MLQTALALAARGLHVVPKVSSDEITSEKFQEQIFQIQKEASDNARLANVAYRIELANRADCKDKVEPRVGINSVSLSDLPVEVRPAAVSALNLAGDQSTIIHVVDGGPAAKAGVFRGDVLMALDNETVPSTKAAAWMNERIKRNGVQPVNLTIARSGQTRSITIVPEVACAVPVILANSGQANAFTDGQKIVIYSRILQIAQSDDELALVVGHELAHVNMKTHREACAKPSGRGSGRGTFGCCIRFGQNKHGCSVFQNWCECRCEGLLHRF
jgi:beta-barrel assembly-enhancing protease